MSTNLQSVGKAIFKEKFPNSNFTLIYLQENFWIIAHILYMLHGAKNDIMQIIWSHHEVDLLIATVFTIQSILMSDVVESQLLLSCM